MAFEANMALNLALLVLLAAVALSLWAGQQQGSCVKGAKIIAKIVAALAIMSILCTVFESYKLWKRGPQKSGRSMPMFMGTPPTINPAIQQSTPNRLGAGMNGGQGVSNPMMQNPMMQNKMMIPPQGGQGMPANNSGNPSPNSQTGEN